MCVYLYVYMCVYVYVCAGVYVRIHMYNFEKKKKNVCLLQPLSAQMAFLTFGKRTEKEEY